MRSYLPYSFPFSYKMTHGLFYFKFFFNLPLCSKDSQGWISYYVLLIGGKNSIIKDILESRQVKKVLIEYSTTVGMSCKQKPYEGKKYNGPQA